MTNERIEDVIKVLEELRDFAKDIADDDREKAEYKNGAYNSEECIREARYFEGKVKAYEYAIDILNRQFGY